MSTCINAPSASTRKSIMLQHYVLPATHVCAVQCHCGCTVCCDYTIITMSKGVFKLCLMCQLRMLSVSALAQSQLVFRPLSVNNQRPTLEHRSYTEASHLHRYLMWVSACRDIPWNAGSTRSTLSEQLQVPSFYKKMPLQMHWVHCFLLL